jgi:hypothetical protein
MPKKTNGLDVELSEPELEYLKKIHVAQTLADFMRHPGWELYTELIANFVARMEDQHLNFACSGGTMAARDAYWASGIRLGGVRQFAKILQEEIGKRVDILNQPLVPPQPPDPAELDGEQEN